MNFDWISSAIGAVFWEAFRQLLAALAKRSADKGANQRKIICDQCTSAKTRMTDCLSRAIEYLTADCKPERRVELARGIKHDLQALGQTIKEVNQFADGLGIAKVSTSSLVAFRQAITWHLDSKSFKPRMHDSSEVQRAYETGQAFQTEMTRLQISAT